MWDDSTKRRLKAEPSLRKTIFDFDLPVCKSQSMQEDRFSIVVFDEKFIDKNS